MGLAIKFLAVPGAILCIVAMLVIPQLQYRKNKENYFNLGLDEE
jgi:PTS system ascorbate-specific IIC component